MKNDARVGVKNLGLWVWGVLTATTIAIYFMLQLPEYPRKALPLVWCLFSWNFYAYAFDKSMWPTTFVELDGHGKGKHGWRTFWFWLDVSIYGALLLTVAFVS